MKHQAPPNHDLDRRDQASAEAAMPAPVQRSAHTMRWWADSLLGFALWLLHLCRDTLENKALISDV